MKAEKVISAIRKCISKSNLYVANIALQSRKLSRNETISLKLSWIATKKNTWKEREYSIVPFILFFKKGHSYQTKQWTEKTMAYLNF